MSAVIESTVEAVPAATRATVRTDDLRDALKKFAPILRKPCRRLADAISVTISESAVILYATNLELSLCVTLPASDDGRAEYVVGYKAFVAGLASIKTSNTILSLSPEWLTIVDVAGEATAQSPRTMAADELPVMPNLPVNHTLAHAVVDGHALADAFALALPATAHGDTHHALNGVYLGESQAGGIDVAASDTYRLHLRHLHPCRGIVGEMNGCILHPEAAKWLAKCAGEASSVAVTITENEAFFTADNWEFMSRQINGTFPHYQDIITPEDSLPGQLTVRRADLLDAVKAAAKAVDNDNDHKVTIRPLEGRDDAIEAVVTSAPGAFLYRSAPITAAARKCPRFTCNALFLADLLATLGGDLVTLRFDAGRYKGPVHAYSGDSLLLLMPTNSDGPGGYAYVTPPTGPDQDYPGPIQAVAACTKRPPSYKAVVAAAKADPGYLSSLLAALGIQAAAVQ